MMVWKMLCKDFFYADGLRQVSPHFLNHTSGFDMGLTAACMLLQYSFPIFQFLAHQDITEDILGNG